MTNRDAMRDDAIKEYLDSLLLDDAHKCAALMKLCDTMETVGRLKALRGINTGRQVPTLRSPTEWEVISCGTF